MNLHDVNDALKPSCRLPRSGRFIAVGPACRSRAAGRSFSVGLWNAVAWSVLIHTGAIGVALWTWDMRTDQRATPLFAQGEQSVTVTNLRFISAAELEEMEHPRPRKLEPTPPPPEVKPPEVVPPNPEPRTPKLPPPPPPPEVKPPEVVPPNPEPRTPVSETRNPKLPPPPPPPPPEVIPPNPEPRTPTPTPAPAAAPTGVTRGAAVAELTVPKYPLMSRRLNEQGLVVLAVTVDGRGHVTGIEVLSDPGYPRLVEAAKNAARQARFIPAMRDGLPVTDTVRVPFRFRLSGS